MGIQMLNLTEKFSKNGKPRNGVAFWAFLLSIFIYISVFYVFKLSPLALFNTTKFWFFISNTLILIIAADFGAFSTTQQSHGPKMREPVFLDHEGPLSVTKNLIGEAITQFHDQDKSPAPQKNYSHVSHRKEQISLKLENDLPSSKMNEPYQLSQLSYSGTESGRSMPEEKIKDVVVAQNNESHYHKCQITEEDDDQMDTNEQNQGQNPEADDDNAQVIRSKSEADRVVFIQEDEKKIQRSQSEGFEHEKSVRRAEENDFSSMSDDELNRRVEEFIQKFNREIRLQAVTNHHYRHVEEV